MHKVSNQNILYVILYAVANHYFLNTDNCANLIRDVYVFIPFWTNCIWCLCLTVFVDVWIFVLFHLDPSVCVMRMQRLCYILDKSAPAYLLVAVILVSIVL